MASHHLLRLCSRSSANRFCQSLQNKSNVFCAPSNEVFANATDAAGTGSRCKPWGVLLPNRFQLRSMATSSTSPNKPSISEAQRRSAQLELEQMNQSTTRLLGFNLQKDAGNNENRSDGGPGVIMTEAIVNEARVVLNYWSRRWYMHFHPGFGRAAKGSALSVDTLRNYSFRHAEKTDAPQLSSNLDHGGKAADDMFVLESFSTIDEPMKFIQNRDVDIDSTPSDNMGSLGTVGISGDHGARQAERVLDWSIANNLISHGLFNFATSDPLVAPPSANGREIIYPSLYGKDPSPNLTCVNMIETYLLPCAYAGMGGGISAETPGGVGGISGGNDRDAQNEVGESSFESIRKNELALSKRIAFNHSYIRAVADATRVLQKMKQLQEQFPNEIWMDELSVKAELNIWSKRALVLGRKTTDSTEGVSPKEILISLERESIKEFKDNPDHLEENIYRPDAYTPEFCIEKMEYVLSHAEERYLATKDERLRPSVDWYNHLLGAYARSDVIDFWDKNGGDDTGLEKMKLVLRGMEAFCNSGDINEEHDNNTKTRPCYAAPDTISYNTLLFRLARETKARYAKEAGEILAHMKELSRNSCYGNPNARPDDVTYGTVLHALAQAGMAREAEKILDELEEGFAKYYASYGTDFSISSDTNNSENGEDADNETINNPPPPNSGSVIPNITIYNSVLNAYANSCIPDAPNRAESLLLQMKHKNQLLKNNIGSHYNSDIDISPDTVSISTLISCHSRSKTKRGAERAEALLNWALDEFLEKGNGRVKPDLIMFHCAISGWANCSGVEADAVGGKSEVLLPAQRAEALLQKMQEMNHKGTLNVHPVEQTYNIVMDCWAKSGQDGAADRALKLLREMPKAGIAPDECSYNSLLHAISKERDSMWVKRAEEFFEEMKQLRGQGKLTMSNISYHTMMNIYGKSDTSDGARKAADLLRLMQKEGVSPNSTSFNICIDACARRAHIVDNVRNAEEFLDEMVSLCEQGDEQCQPTIHSFASVVNALAKSGSLDAVDRAKEIIRRVEELEYVSPNSILYNSLIDCIVRVGGEGSSQRAQEVIYRMERVRQSGNPSVRPDSHAYSMVLTCCARSSERGAAERAEYILNTMETLHAAGHSDVIANARCYSAVITAWARSGSPDATRRSFALLDRMEQNGKTGSPHSKPNSYCYNACIHSIAKSSIQGKAKKCQEVLQRMIAAQNAGFHESAPTLITYSTILNACAYDSGTDEEKRDAFELARSSFLTLLESSNIEPCSSCFANFFLVLSRHLKKGETRDQIVEAVFLEGCKRGKMGVQGLKSFRRASPFVARKLLPQDDSLIPKKWCCNA